MNTQLNTLVNFPVVKVALHPPSQRKDASPGVADCYHKQYKFANLISKLNFYKLIPYPMDNSLSGRRRPARQTSEKDVLCLHQQVGSEYQCTRQMACRTSFLSRQSDVIASFLLSKPIRPLVN